ncbi:MAG: hypothetical protein EA357_00955 [Micavibrio sp.]|nr:MAG: hypothetical protein EA357_00955 [Micavibrio sp.]
MTTFNCIGLDIRKKNPEQGFSADATVWEMHEELYDRAQGDLGINQNFKQLLQPENAAELSRLYKLVTSTPDAVLVSLDVSFPVFEAFMKVHWLSSSLPPELDEYPWRFLGYDICDADGFFSYIFMTHDKDKTRKTLFDEDRLTEAFSVAEAANLYIPSHAPFVVTRLRGLNLETDMP